jgi:hypothetical protein
MCSSVFHFAIVVTVVEEDIMTLQVMKLWKEKFQKIFWMYISI